jgi:hypothetical protein
MVKKPLAGAWLRRSAFLLSLILAATPAVQAHALSELREIPGSEGPDGPSPDEQEDLSDEPGLPSPDPLVNGSSTGQASQPAKPLDDGKPVEVLHDIEKVPEPVRKTRQLIVEAAASGDINQLRPLLGSGAKATDVAVGETAGDPVNTLKELAGDPDGIEILSTILNIMGSGFVHVSPGTPDEAYVWPYFAAKPLANLTPPEKVELMRIVTAGDYQDMLDFGSYSFYRIGIAPDGTWKFFRSGE